jgi:glycosyltransferase involved in cell wall biosynthesis
VLVDAIRRLPADMPVDCHVWGVAGSPDARAYFDHVRRCAKSDPRIIFEGTAESAAVLSDIEILVVPSLWMETGPLVVLEAFAAGVAVIGSNLGGIAEKVRHGIDGWLVSPGDARQLAQVIATCSRNRRVVEGWRAQIKPVRTVDEVASDTYAVYRSLSVTA